MVGGLGSQAKPDFQVLTEARVSMPVFPLIWRSFFNLATKSAMSAYDLYNGA